MPKNLHINNKYFGIFFDVVLQFSASAHNTQNILYHFLFLRACLFLAFSFLGNKKSPQKKAVGQEDIEADFILDTIEDGVVMIGKTDLYICSIRRLPKLAAGRRRKRSV